MSCVSQPGAVTHATAAGDVVIQLREWGTERIHVLPFASTSGRTMGSSDACTIRLADETTSSIHAHLRRESRSWFIRALDRDQGLLLDGARCDAFGIEPGAELGVGRLTLIAESQRTIAVRGFLRRILGWGADRLAAVDVALRALRMAAARRTALWLCGDGDLVPLARSLHHRVFGTEQARGIPLEDRAPAQAFVVCDPHRRDTGRASVRSPVNYHTVTDAVRAAAEGTLCIRSSRAPTDFSSILAAGSDPTMHPRLIVCTESRELGSTVGAARIVVPALGERTTELPRIVDEYALDAVAMLSAAPEHYRETDRTWLLEHAASSLQGIEKGTLRLVAFHSSSGLSHAARRLHMAPVSLARWLARRSSIPGFAGSAKHAS